MYQMIKKHTVKKLTLLILISILLTQISNAQKTWPLYEGPVPNSKNCPDKESNDPGGRQVVRNITVPTLSVYLPEKPKPGMAAVIICPGGGYTNLSIQDGGIQAAKEFASFGVVAFVLKYRTSNPECNLNNAYVPLQDLQQAIFTAKNRAKEWGIDSAKVGVTGFSAGGHLATLAATQYRKTLIKNGSVSLKPAFTILAYPVISFTAELTSAKSSTKSNLLGKNPTQEQIKWFSPELNIDQYTPPAFLLHASDDSTALVENSIVYYQALRRFKIPVEMVLYQKGGHGFATYNKAENDHWVFRAINWMKVNGFN